MTLADAIMMLYPLVSSGTMDKAEKVLTDGTLVKIYRVREIIRIDITPVPPT